MRASSYGIALIAAGISGIILGIVGAHTGNPTVGEQKWYWLVTAISLLPLGGRVFAVPQVISAQRMIVRS